MIKNLSNNNSIETDSPFDENLLGNGLIGNLASKELAEEINMDDLNLNIDENSGNVNDIGKFQCQVIIQ